MTIGLWATLRFKDADAAIAWLKAIGFTEHAAYRNEDDSSVIEHAQMLWPAGGGIMFGTERASTDWPKQAGTGATYLVCKDVDGTYQAALDAGGSSLREPRDEDYGGRGASVLDPEGNAWSFGTYQPA